MNIITQDGENVNVYASDLSTIAHQLVKYGEQWMEKKQASKAISAKLIAIKKYGRAYRMQTCAEEIKIQFCPKCGTKHVLRANLCRDRFCPICVWRLSMKRFANMVQIVQGLREEHPAAIWEFCTLTVANCQPKFLKITLDEMARAWNCIWSRRTTKDKPILGWARSLEITYNNQTKTFHPHYHILLLWADNHVPSETELHWLENTWRDTVQLRTTKSAQDSKIVHPRLEINADRYEIIPGLSSQDTDDVQQVTKSVLETYKYSVKSKDLELMPVYIFRILDELLKGRHMTAFGGIVKEYAKLHNLTNMDREAENADEEESDLHHCLACGSTQVIDIVGKWTSDGYLWRRDS